MSHPAHTFIFDRCSFDNTSGLAEFHYQNNSHAFTERVQFALDPARPIPAETQQLIDRALLLAFILIGTSYFKTFPTPNIQLIQPLDDFQANFFNSVYQDGLSQFAYENSLTRADLAHFTATTTSQPTPINFPNKGILALQSGGKDSLLTATLLNQSNHTFTPWFLSSSDHHPEVLDQLNQPLITARRYIDKPALTRAATQGALNGHVPVTYIVQSLALIQAILLGLHQILVSIGHEGAEPHAHIDDLAVNHQWSKTWPAEQAFAEYVHHYISPDIQIGSPLRSLSELKIAELFHEHAWAKFSTKFSSCNVANYRQSTNNTTLSWCASCPKCANSFLLFAPFVPPDQLKQLFNNQDLFAAPHLTDTFKGLLGIDGHIKPFECVGEISELRAAYHMINFDHYSRLPFDVPPSDYDYNHRFDSQAWATNLVAPIIIN